MSNSYVPMYIILGIIILIGSLPLFISPFIDINHPPDITIGGQIFNLIFIDPFVSILSIPLIIIGTISFITTGGAVNPISYINNSSISGIRDYLNNVQYIPNVIAFPLLLILIFSGIYFIIKMLPFES